MIHNRSLVLSLLALILLAPCAAAQRHELAIAVGGYFPVNSAVDIDPAIIVQGTYAGRLLDATAAALYFELPVAKTLDVDVPGATGANYTAFFIAPGLKIKLAPVFPLSPYFAVGVGYARFSKSARLAAATQTADVTSSAVFDLAGGVDMKIAPFVSLRGEVRDFYAGRPRITLPVLSGREHNVTATGGVVLRF